MAREKENFREMLDFLVTQYDPPLTLTKVQAIEIMHVSRPHLEKIISKGHIKVIDGKIPIGSVASYLCG